MQRQFIGYQQKYQLNSENDNEQVNPNEPWRIQYISIEYFLFLWFV